MTKKISRGKEVFFTSGKILNSISGTLGSSQGKANLSSLRNSIGKPITESVAIWPIMYEFLPEHFLSKKGYVTNEELAIISTLQLYALHQQGKDESVNNISEKGQWNNVGYSLSALRTGDNIISTDRRFNALITSETFDELFYHLRQMISLLKSKTSEKIDYAALASDLYWFLRGNKENIRLNWARAYYSRKAKGEENNDNE